ncbi:DUF6544 family protein [Candidatus Formimonas warabiya]|uniref:Uncharacterized protein n=1 Tax=Formimonas warabiya TaxID=1761012 RepID=A0A3G1KYP4_FORW1|nr:DUF6544 family protein [Candidatus Formimonas warabiya]ATW27479.1 hypothetical protein DCMF_24430 [Candidatus Formimonas warabiya]
MDIREGILLLLIFGAIILVYQGQSVKKVYQREVRKRLAQKTASSEGPTLTEKDMENLPEPVRKYLAYVGVIGKEKVFNARIAAHGEMRMDAKRNWFQVKTQQYNFFDPAARLFYIRGNMSGIPMVGLDSYVRGKGNMLIKVASLFTVADAKGKEMDSGARVTLFNDMCLLAPATLIDPRIHWETVDASTVKATFEDQGDAVSALLYFNDQGALINFVTDDRYYSPMGKSYQRVRWSTPVKDYQEMNGVKVPTYGEGIWHFAEGDFCYAKFRFLEIEYNCKQFK